LYQQGGQTMKRIRTVAADLQRQFFAALTADERRTLHALLRKLAGSAPV
jgi:DNA-binding MarR family transcriptional regulator